MHEDIVEVGFANDKAVVVVLFRSSKSLSSQLKLIGRLLTRHIQHLAVGEVHDRLEHKCRFANARITTEQYHRPRHKTASKHTVQFLVVHVNAILFGSLNVFEFTRTLFLPRQGQCPRM